MFKMRVFKAVVMTLLVIVAVRLSKRPVSESVEICRFSRFLMLKGFVLFQL